MPKKPDITQLNFKEDVGLGLEFISIDDQYTRTHTNLHLPHRASFYLIFWFKTGNPVHIVDFRPVAVAPDSFVFIRKDAVQFFDQQQVFESSTLLFTDNFFCENETDHRFLQSSPLFNDLTGNTGPEPIRATRELREIWQWMQAEEDHQNDPFHAALLRKYLYSFILLAEREQSKLGTNPRMQGIYFEHILNFRNLLEQHFTIEKGIGFYASKLFVSPKVLTNVTQVTTGKTPKQLMDARVLLEAKRLLAHSHDSIKIIGHFLGFDEPTNFNKFFKKHSGLTPVAFRETFFNSGNPGLIVSSIG